MAAKLGMPVSEGNIGERDAVHVPIVLVTCSSGVDPKQPVKFTDGTFSRVVPCRLVAESHGMVDPFLKDYIRAGEKFYVFLRPEYVDVALRHVYDIKIPGIEPVSVDPVRIKELTTQRDRYQTQVKQLENELVEIRSRLDRIRESFDEDAPSEEDGECRGCY